MCVQFIETGKFLEHRIVPLRNFQYSETNTSNGNLWYPPPISKKNRYRKNSEIQNGSSTTFLPQWDRKLQTEKLDIPHLCRKFLDAGIFLKHRRVPPRSFRVLWDKIVPTERRDIPPRVRKTFRCGKKIWRTETFLYESFQYSETETFIEKL